jgi:AcrR family transcriptional regulator
MIERPGDMRKATKKIAKKPVRKRAEQQRAVETKLTIIKTALAEFADKGFEGASIRTIAERMGIQHQLITYHYPSKEVLWKAVAEHIFTRIGRMWDERVPADSKLTPIERVREEYRSVFEISIEYPEWHLFMLRESRPGSPHMPWLAENYLKPLMGRVLPQISGAQNNGDLPPGDPVLLHYMLIAMTNVLSSLGTDMLTTSGRVPSNPAVIANYWTLLEVVLLDRKKYARKKA